jgi:outer membrane receptor protein involved in Fe transport
VDYDLDGQTRLSADVSYFSGKFGSDGRGAYFSNAISGLQAEGYNSLSHNLDHFSDISTSATLLRKLGGDEHEISVHISRDDYVSKGSNQFLVDYVDPVQADLYQSLHSRDGGISTSLKAEYKGPLPGNSKLVTGYELDYSQQADDNQTALGTGASNAAAVPALTNNFKATQAVHALYATYQRPWGALTVMPGLRLEEVVIDLDQVTQQITASQSYFRVYPTLHLAYRLDENRQITASYSQRVQRPNLQNLNPFRVYNSPLSYSQGNPNLEPQVTDAYELGYEFRQKSTYYLATLYYRDNRKQFTQIQQDTGGGVLLSTQANLGHSRNAGLELVSNGDLLKTLSYNISGNVYWNEIDPGNLTLASRRSGTTVSGRISLNWSPTPKDFFQVNFNGRGKTLNGQGYYGAFTGLNLGYRHKFDDKLALVATLADPFDQTRFDSYIDTASLKQQSRYSYHQRALFLGFTYALGTAKTRASEGFDFGSGGGGK